MAHADDVTHDARRRDRIRAQHAFVDLALHDDARQDRRDAALFDELHDGAQQIDFELRLHDHIGIQQRGVEDAAQAVAARRQHEVEFGQRGGGDRVRQVRAVFRARDEHHLFVEQRMHVERQASARPVDDRRIETAGFHRIDQLRAEAVGYRYFDLRIQRIEDRQRLGQHALRFRRHHSQRDTSRDDDIVPAQLVARMLDVAHDRHVKAIHLPRGVGGRHAMRAALEELAVQFPFELRDLHAERGLHDIEPLGRTRDGAVFEQRDEILNLL